MRRKRESVIVRGPRLHPIDELLVEAGKLHVNAGDHRRGRIFRTAAFDGGAPAVSVEIFEGHDCLPGLIAGALQMSLVHVRAKDSCTC